MDILVFILFALIGTLLGTFTGLMPGIHVNNIALFALILYGMGFNPVYLSSLIVAAMIAHTFLDFIPSTFLGAPTEDTALSVLPMHRLLLQGEGYKAIYLSAIGSLLAMLFALPFIFILQIFFSYISYHYVQFYIPLILISLILFLFYLESLKGLKQMLLSVYVFFLAGIFGYFVFQLPQNYNFVPMNIGAGLLFPLFTGLFGLPTLLLSTSTKIPKQEIKREKIKKESYVAAFYGTLSGALVGFLPGVTSGIASVVARGMYGSNEREDFIVTLGSVNTSNSLFNLAALFIVLHPRSEAVDVIGNMVRFYPWVNFFYPPSLFILLLIAAFISSFLSFFLTIFFGKIFAKGTEKLGSKYGKLSWGIIIFMFSLIVLFSGPLGLFVAFIALLIGLLPPKLGVMRVHLMAVIILPVLLFYIT